MFLEKEVGFKCLASLLGVGHKRLHRLEHTTPDLRYGKKPYMSKPGTWTVDAFLKASYESIAETLPDKLLVKISKAVFICVLIVSTDFFSWYIINLVLSNVKCPLGSSEEVGPQDPKSIWMTIWGIVTLKS